MKLSPDILRRMGLEDLLTEYVQARARFRASDNADASANVLMVDVIEAAEARGICQDRFYEYLAEYRDRSRSIEAQGAVCARA